MSRLPVSVGSDGYTDWVRLPSGEQLNLGTLSIAKFVANVATSGRDARVCLEQFTQKGQGALVANEEAMWAMLTPKRVRFGSADSFIGHDPRIVPTRDKTMPTTLQDDLKNLTAHVVALDKAAGKATPASMAQGLHVLVRLANKIKSPNQSKNETYYNLGEPEVAQAGKTASTTGLAIDQIQAHQKTASQIITSAEQTAAKIDKIASRPGFNAAKARADVHAVTSKVATILASGDLSAEWVGSDLAKLASRADELGNLFAKV